MIAFIIDLTNPKVRIDSYWIDTTQMGEKMTHHVPNCRAHQISQKTLSRKSLSVFWEIKFF